MTYFLHSKVPRLFKIITLRKTILRKRIIEKKKPNLIEKISATGYGDREGLFRTRSDNEIKIELFR
jgi:hypothetical protein